MNFKDREDYERWCRYGHERGWFDKTKDEVASWFGDEDAERRRNIDKADHERQDRYSNYAEGYGASQYPARYGSQVGSSSYRYFESPWRESEPSWHRRTNERSSNNYRGSLTDRYGSRYDDESYYPGNWGGEPRGRDSEFVNAAGGSLTSSYNDRLQRYERGKKGPRNYKRSDDRISDDIHERIDRHLDIDAREVLIEVKDGDVTLKGMVSDRADKRLIEEIAEDVFGVKNVQNLLRINPDVFGEARLGSTSSVLSSSTSKLG